MPGRDLWRRLQLLRGRRGLLRQQRPAREREPAALAPRVPAVVPAPPQLQVLDLGQGRADRPLLPQDQEG